MKLISALWLIISSCSTSLCLESAADSQSISLENHTIISVDQNSPNDNSDCWKKHLTTPMICQTLSLALEGVQELSNYGFEHPWIYIHPGNYTLNQNSLSSFTKHVKDFGMVGSASGLVLVHCSNNAGMKLSGIDKITLTNITFVNCGQYMCQKLESYFRGYIKCNNSGTAELLYTEKWVGVLNDEGVAGDTPYIYMHSSDRYSFNTSVAEVSQVGIRLCSNFNRTDVLCGKCLDSYGPTVNSVFFQCIPCSATDVSYKWVFYILTELFPPTILFGFIMFFNLNLTSAAANSYIFFSQVFVPIFTIYRNKWYMENIGRYYSASYDIWNLNFFKSFRFLDYCIHPDMQAIHVIALDYVVAVYPLFLIGILYAMVTLYNKGFRCVLWCGRPVHRFVARFRRPLKLSTTIAHTFAAFLVLSFTKFTFISFRLLSPSYLYNQTGHVISVRVYYQGDMELFKGPHILYGTIAMTILLLFVFLPTFLLLLFPLKWFRLSVRYFTFELTGGKLELFLNIFYGSFKDGTKPGTRDLRCFAGLYFVFRIVFQCITIIPFMNNIYLVQHIFLILLGFLFAIVRPYRVDFWNNFDTFIFVNMALISVLSQYSYQNTRYDIDKSEVVPGVFVLEIILIGIPLLLAILYSLHKLWKKIFTRSRKKLYYNKLFAGVTDTNIKQSDSSILELIDDRSFF